MKILITGSSSGIGRAIAQKLLNQNKSVIGLARHHEKFDPHNNNYFPYKIDFAELNSLEIKLKKIQSDHKNVDAIICSAGFGIFNELEQFSLVKMQELINVNFLSQAATIKLFLPQMKQQKSGKIIIIGSECSLEGKKKGSMYCASKFALRGFSQALRKECVSANVSVTLINPGLVATPFYNQLNFSPAEGSAFSILPEQIADLVSLVLEEKQNCLYEEINLQPLKQCIKKSKAIS